MNYKMIVDIYDPCTPKGMFSCLRIYLFCEVLYDPKNYGNGCYLFICGNDFSDLYYDVRFDKSFHRNKADVWLKEWAKNYWSGLYGSWGIKRLQISKVDY